MRALMTRKSCAGIRNAILRNDLKGLTRLGNSVAKHCFLLCFRSGLISRKQSKCFAVPWLNEETLFRKTKGQIIIN